MVGNTGTPKARALGAELRAARERAGVSQRALSRQLGIANSTLSRWEDGHRMPPVEDVAAILGILGVSGEQREHLLQLARNPDSSHWVSVGMPDQQRQLAALLEFERTATRITDVSPLLITGMLQTADYARAIMVSGGVPPMEVPTRVAVRVGRREMLHRDDPVHLVAVVGEAALRTMIGGPEVMAEQLRFLVKVSALPNVDLRVLPLDIGWNPSLEGPFVLLEFERATPIVHLENRRSAMFLHEKEDVDAYRLAVDSVLAAAMSPEESSEVIAEEIKRLES